MPGDQLRKAAQAVADLTNDYDLNERGQAVMRDLREALAADDGPIECGICKSYSAGGVVVHESCLSILIGDRNVAFAKGRERGYADGYSDCQEQA